MRCPPFAYYAPRDVDEVLRILAGEGPDVRVIAGGTDLVPNMKRRHQNPRALVSLRRIDELRGVRDRGDGGVSVGACTTLADLVADPRLGGWTAVVEAAASVATPHIRNAATLGGNLCLDTRCNYYNQSYEWRRAIDFCMKEAGSVCWVAPGSPRCLAVSSTDTAPALIAVDAEIVLRSAGDGERVIPLAELYADDGIHYLTKRPDELLIEVRLAARGWRSTYWKLRRREAFDFPVLGCAAAIVADDRGVVSDARVVLGAVASRPVVVDTAELVGAPLSDDRIDGFATRASRPAKPMDNTDFTLGWRKRVTRSYVAGTLRAVRPITDS